MRMNTCQLRINRNIVECKDICSAFATSTAYRINRNIVECKGDLGTGNSHPYEVLIET